MIATTTCMAPPPAFCLQRHIPPTRNQPTHSEHWTNNVNSSPRRGTPPCDGVEQKTCLSGASLFCVRHRASTGVCLRSRPSGPGWRGAQRGSQLPLWARPARTSTVIGAMTSQFGSKSSGYDAVATGVRASRGAPTQEHKSEGLPAYNGLTNTFEFRCQL